MPAIPEYIPLSKGKALFAVTSWRSGSTTTTPACTASDLAECEGKAGTNVSYGNGNDLQSTNNNNNSKLGANSRGNSTRAGTRGRNGRRGGAGGSGSAAGGHGGKESSARNGGASAAVVDDFFVHVLLPSNAYVDSFQFDLKAQVAPLRVFDIGKRRPMLPRSAGEVGSDAAMSIGSCGRTNNELDSHAFMEEETSNYSSSNDNKSDTNTQNIAERSKSKSDCVDGSRVSALNHCMDIMPHPMSDQPVCSGTANVVHTCSPDRASTLIEVAEYRLRETHNNKNNNNSENTNCASLQGCREDLHGDMHPDGVDVSPFDNDMGSLSGDVLPQMRLPPAEILPSVRNTSRSCHNSNNNNGSVVTRYANTDEVASHAECNEHSSSGKGAKQADNSDTQGDGSSLVGAGNKNAGAVASCTTTQHGKDEEEELEDDYLISLLFAESEEAQSAASLIGRRLPQAKVEVVARNRATLSASLVLKFMPTLIKTSEAVAELATFPYTPSYVRLYRSTRNVYQNVLFVKYPNREAAEDSKLRLMRCYIKAHPLKVDFKRRYNNPNANASSANNISTNNGVSSDPSECAIDTKSLPQVIRELRVSNEHEGVAFDRANLSREELKTLKQLCQAYDLLFEITEQRVTARRQLKGSVPSKSVSPALRPQGGAAGCHATPPWAPTTPASLRPMDFKGISHWKDIHSQSNSLGIIRPIGPGSGVSPFSAGRGRQI